MAADWSIAVGVLVFLVAIVIASIYYFRYKKVYLILFIASISTYVFSVFYMLDVFEFTDKNIVLLVLGISTILMFFVGKYFSGFKLKHTAKPGGKWVRKNQVIVSTGF